MPLKALKVVSHNGTETTESNITQYINFISTNEHEIKHHGRHFNAGKHLSKMKPIMQVRSTLPFVS